MSHKIELKEGAFIVSDAHYSKLRPELLSFMQDIYSKKLAPTQLILMGDIFDTLFGEVEYTHKINSDIISLINKISHKIEVLYLEGNHDFNLEHIFPFVKCFKFQEQPVSCSFKKRVVYLAHGDFDGPLYYKLYTYIIRNHFVLSFLRAIDKLGGHFILNILDKHLKKKDDCKQFVDFEHYIQKRLANRFDCDFFIEGHFHQNSTFECNKFNYINLAAFACNQRYFIVKSDKDDELFQEIKFSKEI